MRTVLGIDPGSTRAGYGVIKVDGHTMSYVTCGIFSTSPAQLGLLRDKNDLLTELYASANKLIKKYKPDIAGIERLFFVKNMKTGLEVAQSRGVILLALRQQHIPVCEYTPREIKQWLTGTGIADKKVVTRFVRSSLKIPANLRQPDDAYDGLAIALITAYATARSLTF